LVPVPVTRLAAQDVLVREWIEGSALGAAEASDGPAAALVEFVFGGCPAGLMNTGVTAEDVLVLGDGRLAVLDHGSCCDIDRCRLAGALAALEALIGDDGDGFAGALAGLGWLAVDDAQETLAVLREVLGDLLGTAPVRLDVEAVRGAGVRVSGVRDRLLALVRTSAIAPSDVWPARGVALLIATIARVGASGQWSQLAVRALRDGWQPPA
jgi:predicted unusual protein kinase regulating ubiquinone biosynthesis (AarF/ABC1/UbiB family)